MKSINKMALAAVLALSSAGFAMATAPNVIHVTGSTAYRTADVTAECYYLNSIAGTGGVTAVYFDTSSSQSLNHAASSIIYGPVPSSGAQTIFENTFNGSIGGDEDLVAGTTLNSSVAVSFPLYSAYSNATGVTFNGTSSAVTGGKQNSTTSASFTPDTTTQIADISFSDVYFGTALDVINNTDNTSDQAGTPNSLTVGIVPFVFVANGSTTAIQTELASASMTPQLFNLLYQHGAIPLAFVTGNTSDSSSQAIALGRDIDSGTRATALAETGYFLKGSGPDATVNQNVVQYYPYDSSAHFTADQNNLDGGSNATQPALTTGVVGISASTIGFFGPVGPEDIDDYELFEGNGGYYSGANLQAAINDVSTSLGSVPVYISPTSTVTQPVAVFAYLGVSDAKNALNSGTNPAVLLPYNGIKFNPTLTTTANASLIYTGQYTFWGYEHEFYFGTTTSPVGTAALGLQTQLTGTNLIDGISSAQVHYASMLVSRTNDGYPVTLSVGTY